MGGILLELEDLEEAVFLRRPNRFVGEVRMEDSTERVHVADPGRLEELLYPSARVLVQKAPPGSARKTQYSLVAARDGDRWVLVNTGMHRRLATALLEDPAISPFGPVSDCRAEVTSPLGGSRFDFLLGMEEGDDLWLEVKGCTLRRNGTALFPDAPTVRGTRHLRELTELTVCMGKRTAVLFLVFTGGVRYLAPNRDTDPAFADAFRDALVAGVDIRGVGFDLEGGCLVYTGPVPCAVEGSPGG